MRTKTIRQLLFSLFLIFSFNSEAKVENLSIDKAGFVGTYYPASGSPTQAIIVLGGSEGGIPNKLAQSVAKLGYPTLAVSYFGSEGLPQELEKIRLEYFENAKLWLDKRLNHESISITLVGWSKGAELALILASKDSHISKVVAIAPSAVVWAGILQDWQKTPGSSWTQNNKELTFVPFTPSGPVSGLLDLYTQSLSNRTDGGRATISVEDIKGKVYLFSGGNDEIWPSSTMSEAICKKMNSPKLANCFHFNYPELGHLLEYKFLDASEPMHQTFADAIKGSL